MSNEVYILLGGNQGNMKHTFKLAKKKLIAVIGTVKQESSLYETAAWGLEEQPNFLNQVLLFQTNLSAQHVLELCLKIENQLGRIRTIKNAARIIDIDILFYNDAIIQTEKLTVPHPQLQNRNFVLIPLEELAPNLLHPVFQKTIHQLRTICTDKLEVKKI